MEYLKYEVEDRTIAELLGIQNFTNEESAMLELIKNAYDAQAKCVTLDFNKDVLTISDDGVGMSASDIRKHWMHVGKSNKGYYSHSGLLERPRVLAGSKGVGRFALARLGNFVTLYTKKESERLVKWKTDWNESILDENSDELLSYTHGTKIEISSLRDHWTVRRISNLSDYLSVTYNDAQMCIKIFPQQKKPVEYIFMHPLLGITHVSTIRLSYDDKGYLRYQIDNDEFQESAGEYCTDLNIHNYSNSISILDELRGSNEFDLNEEELENCLKKLGGFKADLYFSLKSSTMADKENFKYKYDTLPNRFDYGIVLYRNAFSIASFEGRRDWLDLNKRVRSSPAAATHPTGSWRVRANQISGCVMIDKIRNPELKDMANRQGLEENIYYKLFVKILVIGISRFEEYRQHIIREVNRKNEKVVKSPTPMLDKVLKKTESIHQLTKTQIKDLKCELKIIKKETKYIERQKKEVEDRYHYDVRILNAFVTVGLKAAAMAHEAGNDQNSIDVNYDKIVNALKEYGFWDELNSPEKTMYIYKNVPQLLLRCKEINHKTYVFMNAMLEQIEKNKFQSGVLNVEKELERIAQKWMHNYSMIKIDVLANKMSPLQGTLDVFDTIFDNLILNTWQQNNASKQNVIITICASMVNGVLNMSYTDNGKGLSQKYLDNPRRILEVHETSRGNGHGLGMWIVNNTIHMTGGEIVEIDGHDGFMLKFYLGDRL